MNRLTPAAVKIALALVFLLLPLFAFAAQPLVLSGNTDSYHLGGSNLDILEDTTGKLTINDVTSSRYSAAFKETQQQVPSYGTTDSAFWFRFTIDPGGRGTIDWLLFLDQPLMDEVDLYVPKVDGTFEVRRSGDTRPKAERALPGKDVLLPLNLATAPQTFYLRTWMPGRAIFPFTVLTQKTYQQTESIQNFIMGGYVGFTLSIVLLGIVLLLLHKEPGYLLYLLYMIGIMITLMMMSGYLPIPATPGFPWLHNAIKSFIVSITILLGVVFTRVFLKTGINLPKLDRILLGFIIIYPLFIILIPFIPPLITKKLNGGAALATSLLIIAAAFGCSRKGVPAALYFLFARSSNEIGFVILSLASMGILPFNLFTKNVNLYAIFFEVVFMSLAVANNYRVMNRRVDTLVNDLQLEVSERAAANRALEEQMEKQTKLEREILKISDNERRSISHELHDGLCQQLAAARLVFAGMEKQFSSAGIEDNVQPLGRLLQEAGDHARRLSRGLWNTDATGNGAMMDMAGLIRQFSEQSGLDIQLSQNVCCSECHTGQLVQIQHIAREALVNAVKHSGAAAIMVMFTCDREKGISLEVQDNGCGLKEWKSDSGMGISIMKHRAEMIGATFTISDASGGGTVVICTAPCHA